MVNKAVVLIFYVFLAIGAIASLTFLNGSNLLTGAVAGYSIGDVTIQEV